MKHSFPYSDRYKAWMQGRAKCVEAAAELKFKDIKKMIMNGEIDKNELVLNPKYKYVYIENMNAIDKLYEGVDAYNVRQERAKEGRYGNED